MNEFVDRCSGDSPFAFATSEHKWNRKRIKLAVNRQKAVEDARGGNAALGEHLRFQGYAAKRIKLQVPEPDSRGNRTNHLTIQWIYAMVLMVLVLAVMNSLPKL